MEQDKVTRIIANMIGRDEVGRYLEKVLTELQVHVDEIVFTDDGSKDNTFVLAKHLGCDVIRLDDSIFETNESLLREISWDHLRSVADEGDWIISIDADEILFPPAPIRELLLNTNKSVVMAEFYHMWNQTHYRVDKAWKPDCQPRIFKFYREGHIMKRSLACGQYPTYVKQMIRDGKTEDLGIKMQHWGYARDEDKVAKFDKYMRIDGGKFHSLSHLESIVDENPTLKEWNV